MTYKRNVIRNNLKTSISILIGWLGASRMPTLVVATAIATNSASLVLCLSIEIRCQSMFERVLLVEYHCYSVIFL